jgi:hypothetical protein
MAHGSPKGTEFPIGVWFPHMMLLHCDFPLVTGVLTCRDCRERDIQSNSLAASGTIESDYWVDGSVAVSLLDSTCENSESLSLAHGYIGC